MKQSYPYYYNTRQYKKDFFIIKNILQKYIDKTDVVLDLGCGTGIGKILTESKNYIGVDNNIKIITYCNNTHYNNKFYYCNAEKYMKKQIFVKNIISIFSLDYLNPLILFRIKRKMHNVFIAIHYNKPYRKKEHYYNRHKFLFFRKFFLKKILIKLIIKLLGGKTYKLLNDDDFFVSIIKK